MLMSAIGDLAPEDLVTVEPSELFAISNKEVEAFRMSAAQVRFAAMRSAVGLLGNLAAIQKIDAIDSIEDIVPVLFSHATYKSYPSTFVERGDFARLTQWLGTLTTHPVTGIDMVGVSTMEQWITVLDDKTPLRLVTSSGTSGKLSFFPRSLDEMDSFHAAFRTRFLPYRDERGTDVYAQELPVIHFGYQHGFSSVGRRLESLALRDPSVSERLYAMYPGRMSPDLLALAGRLAGAAQRGEAPEATIHPSLLERREELKEAFTSRRVHVERFIHRLDNDLRDVQVLTIGGLASIIDAALTGEELGITGLFDPASVALGGGGLKGRPDTPADYRERIKAFLGVPAFYESYGMSEQTAMTTKCRLGYYHVPPYLVPFVLDPDTGQSLGRRGVTTGRFGFLDLLARTYWGGLITGDRVTMLWDGQCECGREGARIAGDVVRYSELNGGDDKITCAGTPDAYDRAIEYVINAL
jgi:hypothetical protein